MMCIGEHGNVIKMLAVSSALFAQGEFPVKSQNPSIVPDVIDRADTATLAGAAPVYLHRA